MKRKIFSLGLIWGILYIPWKLTDLIKMSLWENILLLRIESNFKLVMPPEELLFSDSYFIPTWFMAFPFESSFQVLRVKTAALPLTALFSFPCQIKFNHRSWWHSLQNIWLFISTSIAISPGLAWNIKNKISFWSAFL